MAEGGFFKRLLAGLTKTRDNFVKNMDYIFRGFTNIDDEFYEELEEILIMGDIGVTTTENILEDLKRKVKEQKIKEPAECKELLIESIRQQMDIGEAAYEFENRTSVVLVVGCQWCGQDEPRSVNWQPSCAHRIKSSSGSSGHFPCGGRSAVERMGKPVPRWI